MLRRCIAGAALLAAFISAQASAQDSETVTLYSKGNYQGIKKTLTGPTTNMPPFKAKSVRIPAGQEWEFCNGNTYSGCRRVSASEPSTVLSVRSARPVGSAVVAKPGTLLPPGTITTQSIRGFASEYFVAPERDGRRIAVQNDDQAEQEADALCRAAGWRGSAHEAVQPVNGVNYLADVLCVQKGD
jgi:hypothetical protein